MSNSTLEEKKKNRIEWVDIAKFLGILAIYIGHFGEQAGNTFEFVFAYHVPLFFFLSGCMDTFDKENNYFKYVWKKFKSLIIPYFGFALLIILMQTLILNADTHMIWPWIKIVALGCKRNFFFAGGLWFITCLFVIQIIFKLFKYCKPKVLILLFTLVCVVISCCFFPFRQHELPYNVDAALWYIIFYALGYFLFPVIKKLFSSKKLSAKIIFTTTVIIGIVIAALVYFKVIPITYMEKVEASSPHFWKEVLRYTILIVVPFILIMLNLCISRLLQGFTFLAKMGRETLYLCLNEYILRNLVVFILCLIGLDVHTDNAVMVIIHCTILVLVGCYIVIPFEKKAIKIVKDNIKKIYKN
jgi:fucose 4-O-acetylase-like acetyltransferase